MSVSVIFHSKRGEVDYGASAGVYFTSGGMTWARMYEESLTDREMKWGLSSDLLDATIDVVSPLFLRCTSAKYRVYLSVFDEIGI